MAVNTPVFMVNAHHEPVVVRVLDRATLHNCAPLKRFFVRMLEQGRRQFVLDFAECPGVDSTFLGILVGFSGQLLRTQPTGKLYLARMNERVEEVVRNLGLHKMPTIQFASFSQVEDSPDAQALPREKLDEKEGARMVLQAHENLVELDPANRAKFQEVIAFLKSQTE